jgi:hypothetical protein
VLNDDLRIRSSGVASVFASLQIRHVIIAIDVALVDYLASAFDLLGNLPSSIPWSLP